MTIQTTLKKLEGASAAFNNKQFDGSPQLAEVNSNQCAQPTDSWDQVQDNTG